MMLVFVPMLLEFRFHQNQIFLEMVQLNLHLEHLGVRLHLHRKMKLVMKALEHLHLRPVVVMWVVYFQMFSVVLILHNQHHHQNHGRILTISRTGA